MDEGLIALAKEAAAERGKSVSQMFAEFIDLLGQKEVAAKALPPVTASLRGLVKDQEISEASYKKHLREKYG